MSIAKRLMTMIRQRRDRKHIYSSDGYWDEKARSYDDSAVSMWPNRALNTEYDQEQRQLVRDGLGDIRGRRILDLGCGTGRFSRWFAEHGAIVTGTDFSATSLALARAKSKADGPTFRHESIFDLSEEQAYDVIFTWGVLTIACKTREEFRRALERIRIALRPDGRLMLTEAVHAGFLHRVLDLDLDDFVADVRAAGFDVDLVRPLHFWPMRLALAYVSWPAWLTIPCYRLGQGLMTVPGLRNLGDYWAIAGRPTGSKRPTGR